MRLRATCCVLVLMCGVSAVGGLEFELTLNPGWNLISVPIEPVSSTPGDMLEGIQTGPVWEWNGQAYRPADDIVPGRGYWVFVELPENRDGADDPVAVAVQGNAVRGVTRDLDAGWQLVGPITYPPYASLPLPPSTVPDDSLLGACWGWGPYGYALSHDLAPGTGAWAYVGESCEVRLSPDPQFEGAVMAYSPDVGQAQVHWPDAVDDQTVSSAMTYRVYAAPVGARGELIAPENLTSSVTGGTSAKLSGLVAGQDYDVAVLAEDQAGNRNWFNRVVLQTHIMAAENTLTTTPKELEATGADILAVSEDGTRVTVSDPTGLAVGDVIVFDNPNGQGLKRIVGMNAVRDGTELVTEDACLADVIGEGELRSSLLVSDMDAVPQSGGTRDGDLVYDDPAGAFSLGRSVLPDGREEAGEADGSAKGKVSFEAGLDVDYGIEFEPSFETHARFGWTGLTYCRLAAKGELSADASAIFHMSAKASYEDSRKVFSVSHTFFYAIGPCPACLPVWQDVGIDVYVAVDVQADATLDMEAVYKAIKTIEIGIEYSEGEWSPVTSDGFEQEMRFDVHAEGNLAATVSVYPRIWTRFYGMVSGRLYVVPELGLDSTVRFIPLPVELTKFDIGLEVDAFVEAAFGILDKDIDTWQSPHWTMLDMDLFSLPEIAFDNAADTITLGSPEEFRLDITDGVNNAVPAENITWWVEAAGRALPQIGPSGDRRSAEVTGAEEGTYTLWASCCGDSLLGNLGTRYASTEFTVAAGATTGEYLLIDLSGGPSASSYPVSSVDFLPDPIPDVYRTTKLVMRRIPAGTFTMGSPPDEVGRDDDETQHQVTLTEDFYIGVFEVTQKQWERVMGTWPGYFTNAAYRETRSVEQVSYDDIRGNSAGSGWPANNDVDADSFMGKLRAKTGLLVDLPTEAQWEYTCRAGTTTALNSGKNLTDLHDCPNMAEVGRYRYNGGQGYSSGCGLGNGTAEAGSYRPNAWGLYDMHGNVWEWCLDWHQYDLGSQAVTDPVGGSTGSFRVLRGGSWFNLAEYCRSAFRNWFGPNGRFGSYGLRVCSAPPGQ